MKKIKVDSINYFTGKSVAVAGGSGFLGTNYILELLDRGAIVKTHTHKRLMQIEDPRVEVLENLDLSNFDDCCQLVDGVDCVIDSLGVICHPSEVATDTQKTLENIIPSSVLLEASYKAKVKNYLNINSSTGYPDRGYPVMEDEYFDDEPYISYYGYGWMRRYKEKVLEHVSHFSDMKIALARGSATFGLYDNFDLNTCHVIPALIKRVLSGENPLSVWGSEDVVRDFIYSKDLVNGALSVLENGKSMRPYNIGYGHAVTIGEVVSLIIEATGRSPKVVYDKSKPTTIPLRMVNVERAKRELGFSPSYSLSDGIRETVNFYIKNYLD
jgi:GDP-L-fucose synthase